LGSKLNQNALPISMLALKTPASQLPSDYDFGTGTVALDPEAATGIHDYVWRHPSSPSLQSTIKCLILDTPSADAQSQSTSHQNFFGIQGKDDEADDIENRALIELAYFANVDEGYYFGVITPPRFETNAVATGVYLYPLEETDM